MVEEKKEEKKERFVVEEVPTQSAPLIADTEEKDVKKRYNTIETAVAKILNNQEKLLKAID